MASNYTSNYNLCQWAASDKVLRTEFNADNAKIDAALKALDRAIDDRATSASLDNLKAVVNRLTTNKADRSALDSLSSTVNGLKTSKADRETLNELSRKVNGNTEVLAQKGNCQLCTVTYTGDGAKTKTVTFPGPPLLTFFFGLSHGGMVAAARGMEVVHWYQGSSSHSLQAACSGNSVTLTSTVAGSAMNENRYTYIAVALVPADE